MAPFYGWGSTASRLEPLQRGSLLFTTKFPNVWMVNCLILSICYFHLHQKCLQKFCLIEKLIVVEITDQNVFKIMTLSNNLVLVSRFYNHNLVFSSFYVIREICIFAKIWFMKTSTRIVKTKSRVIKSNPASLLKACWKNQSKSSGTFSPSSDMWRMLCSG